MNNVLPVTLYWELDGWILLMGALCAVNAALLGHFLVLRKMSMLGDAISHSVLPGIALAFILFQSRNDMATLIFASLCGVVLVICTEFLRKKGQVDEGAALGISFIALFALGLILIVHAADYVDLDPSCVLFGGMELVPLLTSTMYGYEIPAALPGLLLLLVLNALLTGIFYKELLLVSFDEVFADVQGMRPHVFHYLFLVQVAVTAVLCFEVFGTILVVAMFVVPVACGHLLSRNSKRILFWSVVLSVIFVCAGHFSAVTVPRFFGFDSTNSAGMISLVSGIFFLGLFLFSPAQGMVSSRIMKSIQRFNVQLDDYLASLYRAREGIIHNRKLPLSVIAYARIGGYVSKKNNEYHLNAKGLKRAKSIIRSHRLWEAYLSDEAGYMASRVHPHADGFEHYTNPELQQELESQSKFPEKDPHGRKIP
jgi:manganese/zinc/iron transport system permease protein